LTRTKHASRPFQRFESMQKATSEYSRPPVHIPRQLYERTGMVASEDSEEPVILDLRRCAELAVFAGISRLKGELG